MADHNILGAQGERIAADFLERKGYAILYRNKRIKRIEIDLIVSNEEYIIFVEVKTRASNNWGNPELAVDEPKIRRMVDAADFFLDETDDNRSIRFDVVSVILKNETDFEIKHIEDAFLAPLDS